MCADAGSPGLELSPNRFDDSEFAEVGKSEQFPTPISGERYRPVGVISLGLSIICSKLALQCKPTKNRVTLRRLDVEPADHHIPDVQRMRGWGLYLVEVPRRPNISYESRGTGHLLGRGRLIAAADAYPPARFPYRTANGLQ